MSAVTVAAGVLLVALGLRDVFHTLFHPGGHGGLAGHLCRGSWIVMSRLGQRGRALAGPTGLVLTIAAWLGTLLVGFALLLLPLVPEQLAYGSGSPRGPALVDALYLSAVSISTLGLGDVVVQDAAWRWLAPLEALLGFGVLTAAITWITQIYPALARRRSLALEVWAGHGDVPDGADGGVGELDPATLRHWTHLLAAVDVDLVQNTETFWFRERDARLALTPAMHRLRQVADAHQHTVEGNHLGRLLRAVDDTLRAQYGRHAAR